MNELSPRHIADLLTGWWHRTTEGPDVLWESPDERRHAWLKNREEILKMNFNADGPPGIFQTKGSGPGARPRAWWDYEAPEPLRWGLATSSHDQDDVLSYQLKGAQWPSDIPQGRVLVKESETALLNRLGLLTAAETKYFEKHGWPAAWEEIFPATLPGHVQQHDSQGRIAS